MNIQILSNVSKFLEGLSREDDAKIAAHLKSLAMDQTDGLAIKPLKGKIKELIVRQYRIVFFKIGDSGYVVDVFRKQSKKTPKRTIERAERIYRDINAKQ
ncbi:MAG: type II toxin-antitoxin system RelE/ParE family toxin [Candidatus Liptonbacteria bacterium]|nr:type II toxin-antitoxin system RelE/ParE family toxin [Candidatus Liptonbacteria bacterium]